MAKNNVKRIEHRIVDGVEEKYCKTFEHWVPLISKETQKVNFTKNKNTWDGLQSLCNSCRNKFR